MKYHTIKSERYHVRCNGAYATYPIYKHETGEKVAILECYSECVNQHIKRLNETGNLEMPFFPLQRYDDK
jgi:3-methyladenine DNA glycosylase AlkC